MKTIIHRLIIGYALVVIIALYLATVEAPAPSATPLPSATPALSPEPIQGEVFNPSHVWTPQVLTLCASTPVYGRPDETATPLYTLPRRSSIVPREWLPGWFMIQPAHYIRDNTICHPADVDWRALKRPQ